MVLFRLELSLASEAAQFENMIATSLYRFVVSLYDRGWPEVKLYYHRTYDKSEIDLFHLRIVEGNAHSDNPLIKQIEKTFV